MAGLRGRGVAACLAVGLVVGLVAGGFVPHTPLHAVATDHSDNFVLATGLIDQDIEAIYFLDSLTGALQAGILAQAGQGFQARYTASVQGDLAKAVIKLNAARGGARSAAPEIQFPAQPRYMMVTGLVDVRRGTSGRTQPAAAVVYVAEANTGILLSYVVPWDSAGHSANQPVAAPLILWAADRFSTAVVRQQ